MCKEKRRLLAMYEFAEQVYHQAMNELKAKMGTSPRVVYERVFHTSEAARSESAAARAALLKHVREHKC